ncbi:hypothetical protein DPEC_G00021050 [Dallia pectoralis]|uniref:Uncharacterized protein n=1 Tax=Dallia pectoralis TaxID=75939 RepID=A0ACC2HGI6_DALPE|nr:hypothetical protein DPEC_G00021050 [Dallia pectoralis]
MATSIQTLPLTRDPKRRILDSYSEATLPTSLLARCSMGSVGSLVERPASTPTKGNQAVPQVGPRHVNGVLKKGFNQRQLLNYLNITRKEPRAGSSSSSNRKDMFSSMQSIKREPEEENIHAKVYHKDGTEVNLSKNSMGGKFVKSHVRPSAFKPVTPKNFSSMQNLYPSKTEDSDHGLSNGLHRVYTNAPKAVSTSSSSSSPSHHRGPVTSRTKAVASIRGLSQEEDDMSDSGHHSINSLPPYRPPFRPLVAQISASMGHINAIGSLDRPSKVLGSSGVAMGNMAMSCRSMATLSHLVPYGDAPPPYDESLSLSVEEVVRDLEERLVEKEHELKQMRRNLDESEGAVAQVFEGKQRLWEKEVDELKHLYAAKLRQVSQNAQRSQRALQMQLNKAQQEKNRLQEKLDAVTMRKQEDGQGSVKETSPTLEESQWQVCQKSGEISLLKRQLRDSQADVTGKLSEMLLLKSQLRESRAELRNRDEQINALKATLQGTQPRQQGGAEECGTLSSLGSGGAPGSTEERLRAELLLERRQSEAQATAFEEERQTWQTEKEKTGKYSSPEEQKERWTGNYSSPEEQEERWTGNNYSSEEQEERCTGNNYSSEEQEERWTGNNCSSEEQEERWTGNNYSSEEQEERWTGNNYSSEEQEERWTGNNCSSEEQEERWTGNNCSSEEQEEHWTGNNYSPEEQEERWTGNNYSPEEQEERWTGNNYSPEEQEERWTGNNCSSEEQKERWTRNNYSPEEQEERWTGNNCSSEEQEERWTGNNCSSEEQKERWTRNNYSPEEQEERWTGNNCSSEEQEER